MNTAIVRSLFARIGATLLLVAVIVGAPIALGLGGSPFTGHWPDWSRAMDDLRVGYVASGTLARVALDAGWCAWVFLTYEIAAESWGVLRRQVSRRTSVLGPLQPVVAKLVAAAILSLPLLAGRPALRPAMASVAIQAKVMDATSAATARSVRALPTYVVQRHDTLWGIAERYLGNPLRWTEIARLNEDRTEGSRRFTDPHWIDPGWTLVLPADAHGLTAIGPSKTETSEPRPAPRATAPSEGPHANGATARGHETPIARRATPAAPAATPSTEPATAHPAAPSGPAGAAHSAPAIPAGRAPLAPIGLGIIGVGLLGVLARYRRVQHRHRSPGRRIPLPTGPLADLEQALSASGDLDAVNFLDGALRLLGQVVRGREQLPTIVGVVLGPESLEIILDTSADAPRPFTNGGPDRWRLARDADLRDAIGAVTPMPLLVTIGKDEDGIVLLNLEAGGSIAIGGDCSVATELASAIALELASAPWCETVQLIDIGVGTEQAGRDRCTSVVSTEDALPALRAHVAATRAELVEVGETDAGRARLLDPAEAWSSCAFIANATLSGADLASLDELEEPARHALVLLAPGEWSSARWHLHAAADGTVDVPMLGRHVHAQRVTSTHLAGVAALLGLAARREDVAATTPPYDRIEVPIERAPRVSVGDVEPKPLFERAQPPEAEASRPPERREPTVLSTVPAAGTGRSVEIGVLGPVQCTGLAREPERPKTLELIVWMALHPGATTTDTLAAALWPTQGYSERSLWNRVSDARRCLGPDQDGKPLLERTSGLELAPSVGSDWARFRHLAASDDPGEGASALLLIRGQPFAGVDWPWATVDGFAASIEAQITDLAEIVAERALLDGEPHEATRVADIGILASPYDERLYRLLMRAADAEGNPAGVRSAMHRLATVLEADVEPLESVHPETRMLYEALIRRRRPSEESDNHARTTGAARHLA